MQHFGTEEEMEQVLLDIVATLPAKQRLVGIAPKDRLEGLSLEEFLAGLTPADRERLRLLLQQPAVEDAGFSGPK